MLLSRIIVLRDDNRYNLLYLAHKINLHAKIPDNPAFFSLICIMYLQSNTIINETLNSKGVADWIFLPYEHPFSFIIRYIELYIGSLLSRSNKHNDQVLFHAFVSLPDRYNDEPSHHMIFESLLFLFLDLVEE